MKDETTVGFQVFPLPYETSVKEFGTKYGVDYATAQGFIKFLLAHGLARQAGFRKNVTGKGKPTTVYELPGDVTIKLAA